ncbi:MULTISPECIES: ABC transporter permease [Kosmotoga]|uniref:Inner-membrane translocator n=1 Tax=Kosmotoga olearia (strain ATCC BAA-1733 / DSM 21960 / TBF 19.5.1) TaxID=521045 RepID=C5CE78_KOSOT|nr:MULTISPECIES: ABC transporter permease [Kosmotoga]ACR79186.1 inner-membrane translocator [Kosmotoga olearia TBF 19.5.1]MDI3523758.1 ral nucleoside transport system permease protein [Kosmotoga sp.]MDK2953393.1 ral nucleoside transport system permease protein [Kosmotoga sp.]OAA23693.1 ABC transporter permease [Kosmotoga sp. DU53]
MRLRIEKRANIPAYMNLLVPVVSIAFSLLVMGIILVIFFQGRGQTWGEAFRETLSAYKEMFSWPFGNIYGLYQTLVKMIPLAFVGLGLSFAYRMKIWNIGGEGQLYMGAFAATWGALYLFNGIESKPLMIFLLLVMGAIFGGLWGAIPAFMKAFAKTDEIVVTLMLNYVAIFWVDYLVYGPWKDPKGYNFPITAEFPESARLPALFNGEVHIGIIFVIILAFILQYVYSRTKWGFNSRIVGDNPMAAKYSGIDVKTYTIVSLIISGMIAGMGGAVQMMGIQHRLQHGFSPGYGYTAIIIAWLAKLNPIGVLVAAFLFGGLLVGNEQLQMFFGLPLSLVYIFQGLVLFSLLGGESIFRYRIRFVKEEEVRS